MAPPFPLVDYHVHAFEGDGPLEDLIAQARQRGAAIGVVEHAGRGQTLSTDADLQRYVQGLRGRPVRIGIQAEGRDWPQAFSPETLAQLDFVLTDVLKYPCEDGTVLPLWEPDVTIDDVPRFMDRYVALAVQVLSSEPFHILANPTYLPHCLQDRYAELWTPERRAAWIDAAVAHGVALEINARYRVPDVRFVREARDAGARFAFGTNTHGAEAGCLEYCLEVAREVGLTEQDLFPA